MASTPRLRELVALGGPLPNPVYSFVAHGYNVRMEISFAPELEARLNQIASQTGKGADEVVRELVANYLDHDQWFRQEVAKGLASLDQGKLVSHDEVRRRMGRKLGLQ
jgi:predicted transcriptional regulator